MKRNWVLVTMVALLLGTVFFFAFRLYSKGVREVLSQFQRHQLEHAEHVSKQIRFFIQARVQGIRALSSFPSLQYGDVEQLKADIQAYSREIESVHVKRITVYNDLGTAVDSTNPNPLPLREAESAVFAWAKQVKNKDAFFLAPISLESQSLTLILATPLYQNVTDSRYPKPTGKFLGVLAFSIDMKEFLTHQLDSVDTDMHLDQVWIMNNKGTLLFQSKHLEELPGMLFRNIHQREESCDQCHFSFSYAEQILSKKRGTVEYRLEKHPKKIAAFAPMEIESVSWVVVVSAPYDQVTSFLKSSLQDHLCLLGITALGFSICFALILRSDRMKIRAEEEVTRWQEKMAERRKAEEALQRERNKLKEILDSMNDGVCIVNQQNEIQYANPVIEREFGPVDGRHCHEYFNDLPEACSWCKNHVVFAGGTVRWEGYFSKTGKAYDLIDTPFAGPEGTLWELKFFHDITERKRAGDALKESERQLRNLSFQVLTAQETERKRISRELHDELGQALTAMKLRLSFIEKNLTLKGPNELKQECRYGVEYINQVIEDVRRLSRDLSPTILEDFGLYAAIRWLVNNFEKNYDTKATLEMADIDSLLHRSDHVIVYRIIQEALTNVGKHSRARNVSIAASTDGITVMLSIEDDGVGFDAGKAFSGGPEDKGLGLATMKGRAEMLGGVLEVRARGGRGTRITLTIPIREGGST